MRLPLAVALAAFVLLGCSGNDNDKKRGRVATAEVDTETRTSAIRENLAGFAADSVLERYRAMRSMLDLGRSADPYLIEALSDPHPRVRSSAKLAILFQSSPEMVQPLFGAFRQACLHKQVEARAAILFDLIGYGRPAIPYLLRLLGEEKETRVLAVYAILEILEMGPSGELPGPDDPQLASFWSDWWSRNQDTFVDPVDVAEPLGGRVDEVAEGIQKREYFTAALAQQRFRILYYLRYGESESAEALDPWRGTVGSLGGLRRDPELKPMDRDLLGVMIAMSFELTNRGAEALDVLNAISPGVEHGGGAPILTHLVHLAKFWAYRRLGDNPNAATSLEAAISLLEGAAVPGNVGLRRLYRVHRAFFDEWSAVK